MAGVTNQARKTKTTTSLFILLPSHQDALPLITTRSSNRLDTLCQTHHRIAIRPRPDHQRSENLPPGLSYILCPRSTVPVGAIHGRPTFLRIRTTHHPLSTSDLRSVVVPPQTSWPRLGCSSGRVKRGVYSPRHQRSARWLGGSWAG